MTDNLNVVIEKEVEARIEELNHDTALLVKEFGKLSKADATPGLSSIELERKKENTLKRICLNKAVVRELRFVNLSCNEDLQAYLHVIETSNKRTVDLIESFPEDGIILIDDYRGYIKSKAVLSNINSINVRVRRVMEGWE